ncbi:unnamed protein product, partial [marine sediment metagenome]
FFKRTVAGFYLWWDGIDTWYISDVLGTPGALGHWTLQTASPVGVYTPVLPATGDVEVTAGEHVVL